MILFRGNKLLSIKREGDLELWWCCFLLLEIEIFVAFSLHHTRYRY